MRSSLLELSRSAEDLRARQVSDEEVMGLVGRDDGDALMILYRRFVDRVYGLAKRVVRDPTQAEDVTQEVFFELWRRRSAYDPARGSVAAWVFTLAHRRAVDRVRKEQAARNRAERSLHRHEPLFDPVYEGAEAASERAQVQRALERLTPLQREAIELAYFGGHTYRQVAERLGVAEGTAKTRIRDGLSRLRDSLDP